VRFISSLKSSFLIFILLISPAQAQELKNQIYVIDDFSKGLDLKSSPFSLSKGTADICENIRINEELKSISKRDEILLFGTADTAESILGMHRLYLKSGTKVLLVNHGDEIETASDTTGVFTPILTVTTGDHRWNWTTWNNQAIGTDGYNQPVKYDGSSASATYLGSCLATDAGSGAGPNGTYTYKVVFYTASYSISLGVASNSITVVDNDITLTMIPIAPDTVYGEDIVGRKIYRSETGGAGTYKLLSNGTIADNTTVTLTDSDADGALGAALSVTATYTVPKGKFPLIHKNRLFLANDPSYPSRIYYSEDASPDYFLSTAYFNIRPDDGDEITFAKTLLGILTISKNNTIQKLYTDGDTPSSDWAISDPYSYIGCQAPYTVQESPIGIIYLGIDGLYKFNGQYSTLLSDVITPEIKNISTSNVGNSWGIFHKNTYYMTYTSGEGGLSTNDRVLVYDLLSNSYAIDKLSINVFCAFNSGTDWGVLYSGSSTNGKVYAHSRSSYELIHGTHSDFAGTWDDMRYIPVAVGGDADNPIIEMAWTATIDSLIGTINNMTGTINREDADGNYTSQVLTLGASVFDKLYWNELQTSTGGATTDVTMQIRAGATSTVYGAWSSEYTNPAGSDISGATPNTYVQYKVNMSSSGAAYTPYLTKVSNYVVKITYNKEGASTESTIPLHWRSGWTHLGYPGYTKVLRKVYCLHEGTSGTLALKFENLEGDSDTFNINLATNPTSYNNYFTNGAFVGEWFRLDISETSLYALNAKSVYLIFDVEPIY